MLAGIIFLGIELRQNNNIARTNSYHDTIQDIAEWRSTLATNPELYKLFGYYMEGKVSELSDVEQRRLRLLLNNILGIYENAYFSHELDVIGDEEWERLRRGACLHSVAMRANGSSFRYVTENFRLYLERSCDEY